MIRREAERAGLSDTVVVNSCAVTTEAVPQARQSIRALNRERPQANIVVTGCAAQTEPQMFADMADRVVGNDEKLTPRRGSDARAAFDRRRHAEARSSTTSWRSRKPPRI